MSFERYYQPYYYYYHLVIVINANTAGRVNYSTINLVIKLTVSNKGPSKLCYLYSMLEMHKKA